MRDASGWSQQERLWSASRRGDLSGITGELAEAAGDAAELVLSGDDSAAILLEALATTTQSAMYWQEPDPADMALEDQAIREALLPVVEALEQVPEAAWWAAPMDVHSQQRVLRGVAEPSLLTGIPAALARWQAAEAEEEEKAAGRPSDPAAPWSGHWWSTPAMARLPETSRELPGFGAAGLALVEDPLGWTEASCQPVRTDPNARCYEVDGPDRWAHLADQYPFDVTNSRRHDWWRVTGWAGPWLMPDYAAVAGDYDAVHVTVLGYLTTAGRDISAGPGGARTMLAGWAPDTTFWLADMLSDSGPATEWVAEDGELLWTQAR